MFPQWFEQAAFMAALVATLGAVVKMSLNISSMKAEHRKVEDEHERILTVMSQHSRLLDDLHGWHDRRDEDGILVWHNKHSLDRTILSLADAIRELAATNKNMLHILSQMDKKIDLIPKKGD